MKPTRTGFVGLGNIGKPMALRLAAAEPSTCGSSTSHRNRSTSWSPPGPRPPSRSASSPGNWADVICVMVRDDDQVRDVLAEVLELQRPATPSTGRSLWWSTPRSRRTRRPTGRGSVARTAVRVVDAPVSGGPMGAAEGTLAIMVGGTPEGSRRSSRCLRRWARRSSTPVRLGAGTKFKLARNLLHFVVVHGGHRGARLAEAAGLDLVALGEVVRHTDAITGGPGAIMHRDTTAPIPEGDFWHGVFAHVAALGEKDLTFAI